MIFRRGGSRDVPGGRGPRRGSSGLERARATRANARLLDEARQAARRLQLLADFARELAAATGDFSGLLELAARRVSEAFGDLCVIRLLSADERYLEWAGAFHHTEPALLEVLRGAMGGSPQRVGEGITGRVAATGESALVPVVDQALLLADVDPERRDHVARLRVTSVAAAPLRSRGQVIGVVGLSRTDASRPYEPSDLRLLEDLASHTALGIANARSAASERVAHAEALRASDALRESEEAHRLLFEASPLPLFVFDVDTFLPLAVNQASLLLFGYGQDEFMQMRVQSLVVVASEPARVRAMRMEGEYSGTARYRRKDGTEFTGEYTTRLLTFSGKRARLTVVRDVTERSEAEKARALLASIVQSSNDAIVSKALDGKITSWNRAAESLFGYSASEATGKPITMIIPHERMDEERMFVERIIGGGRIENWETLRVRKDGSQVWVSISLAPILDSTGKVVGASKTARDLTAQRKAAEALQRTEEQLRQAQKMEAVGRLAGGIAHDFNNILSIILSYSAIVLGDLQPGDAIRGDLEEIRRAAVRAAGLTRQLLVFSRQQVIEARVLDLNEVIIGTEKMLKRILGEDIELASILASRLGRIRADPSNVEQVIMNLAVNARDAMPTGGKLTIETADVELDADYAREHLGSKSGPHVMLAVTDTGVGMDQATLARIFEPFFTTKGPGKGTGLGLSTVFGIAQQSSGSVWVYSELGKGTTFKVYFPRVELAPDELRLSVPPATLSGSETILLVEDQDQVRAVAASILRRSGYHVLVAENGPEALGLARQHRGPIHVVVTDVVMPHMSGAELARRLAETRPDIGVLCMSGYTDDSIVRHGVLEDGMAFLQKPFTPDSLTRRVREVLDARLQGRPA